MAKENVLKGAFVGGVNLEEIFAVALLDAVER